MTLTKVLPTAIFLLSQFGAAGQSSVIDSLKSEFKRDSSNTEICIKLSRELRKTSAKNAERYALRAVTLAEATNDAEILDNALGEAGAVYYQLGNIPNASKYYNQRLIIELDQHDSINLILTYTYAAIVRRDSGNTVGALDLLLKAKKIADIYPDKKHAYGVYMTISEFYKDTDFDKAVAYLEEAYRAAKATGEPGPIGNVSFAMAQAAFMRKDISKAKSYLRESLIAGDKAGLAYMKSYVYGIYSTIFKSEKKYDSAIYYSLKAVDVKLKTGDTNRLYDDYGAIGQIYMESKNYTKALEYFSKGRDFSKSVQSVNFFYVWGPTMATAYDRLGNLPQAYRTLREHQVLKDSVMNSERVKAIADMQTKYETEKKEKDIESLKKEQALQLKINLNQKIIFGTILTAALFAVVSFYFRTQASREKNIRLTEKLDAQNRELSTIAMLVTKKNQTLTHLKSKLEKVPGQNPQQVEVVTGVLKDIDNEIAFDDEWDTFKYHFEKVHPDYFAMLKQAAPGLSVTELRLCAYLKSKLSTKEIAQLTNSTVRGVQQAKYRVNQKFKESGGNISDFI